MPATRRKRSAAWKYFKLVDGKVICQISPCTTELTWHGSTTALNAHIQSRHPNINCWTVDGPKISQGVEVQKQQASPTAIDCIVAALSPCSSPARIQLIDEKVCDWIENDCRPACVIEDRGFRELMRTLEPSYTVPSSHAVASMMNARYLSAMESLKRKISDATRHSKVSLSLCLCDETRSWLTLSIHFVTENWELKSFVIGAVMLTQRDRTSSFMVEWIIEKIQEFQLLPSSVVGVVHTNDDMLVNALNMLCELYGWQTVTCANSALETVVKNACKGQEIKESLARVRETIKFFDKGRLGQMLFKNLAENEDVSSIMANEKMRNGLGSPVTCRKYPAVEVSSFYDNNCSALIHSLIASMQPFETAINYLNGDDYVACSSTPILLTGLEKKMADVDKANIVDEVASSSSDDMTTSVANFKQNLLSGLRDFNTFDRNGVVAFAAALDPRSKKLNFMTPQDKLSVYSMLSTECLQIHRDDPDILKQDRKESRHNTQYACALVNDLMELGAGSDEYEDNSIPITDEEALREKVKAEMESYLAEKRPPSDIYPLCWWQVNVARYPLLGKLARSYLCVPATALRPENACGSKLSRLCNHFHACDFNKAVFTRNNKGLTSC